MTKEQSIHPFKTDSALIEERGLVVYEDLRELPSYEEAFSTPYTVIVLNLSGWVIIVTGTLFLVFPILGFITTRTMQAEIARQEKKQQAAS